MTSKRNRAISKPMIKQLPKPNINNTVVLATLVVLIVAAAVGYSSYQYQTNRQPVPTESVAQIKKERNDAITALQLHDAVNKTSINNATEQTNATQAKLMNVCIQLKTLKATNVACN